MKKIPYTEKFVMFPPRASVSIRPENMNQYKGYIAQLKYNGSRTLIFVLPDGTIELWSRHQEPHKQYKMTADMEESIRALNLPPKSFHVLDGELMHSKTRGLKDKIVLYDILVYQDQYFIGSTYAERYVFLNNLCGDPSVPESETGRKIALQVNRNIWIAPCFPSDMWQSMYNNLTDLDEIEGLVLKDPHGKLEFGLSESNNNAWQIRCRKPHKNYAY